MKQRSPASPDASPVAIPTPLKPAPAKTQARPVEGPHELECRIQRSLQSQPGLRFSRLIVHQCVEGVCLEGTLEANDEGLDLCEFVNRIAGVPTINRISMRLVDPTSGSVKLAECPATEPNR